MAEATGTAAPGSDGLNENDPRFDAAKKASGGEHGREMLEHAAQGATLSESEEKSGLDWMLGGPVAMEHTIPADYETPSGMRQVKFVTRMLDSRRIDEIQQRHVNDATGKLDKLSADVEIVASATKYLEAAGRRVELTSDEFLTFRRRDARGELETFKLASTHEALERRWRGQEGVLSGVAAQVTRIAGYDPERVGQAQRRLVDAALG